MKVHEILAFNKELLEKLYSAGLNTSDFLHVDLYNEYARLKRDGLKKAYIVSFLSDQYSMSERKVYQGISKMERSV